MAESLAIGIDLGTTYTCAAIYMNGVTKVIFNDEGSNITPSCVSFLDDDDIRVGGAAVEQLPFTPKKTIFDAKRMIGRHYGDTNIKSLRENWPFEVISKDDNVAIKIDDATYAPEVVSSKILEKVKEMAINIAEQEITEAVITVPAYFNNAQREATKKAAKLAGLNVICTINEPTAAALAYGLNRKCSEKLNVLIYDIGGGTCDISILTIENGEFKVLSTKGNTTLGGQDFTNEIVTFIKSRMSDDDLQRLQDESTMHYFRSACDNAKKKLSFSKMTNIDLKHVGLSSAWTITKEVFDEINLEKFKSTLTMIEDALEDAKINKSEIDEILLVGGSTRILKIQELLKYFFNGKKLNKSLNPDECVAIGAAIKAAMINSSDNYYLKGISLRDICPLSLGIKSSDGLMTTFIKRNTLLPVKCTKCFKTTTDDQPSMMLAVYEGERPMADDNNPLNWFLLDNLTKGPRKTVSIDVTFNIDVDGILDVTAIEKSNNIVKPITVQKTIRNLSNIKLNDVDELSNEDKLQEEKKVNIAKARYNLKDFCLQIESDFKFKKIEAKDEDYEKLILKKCSDQIALIENKEITEERYVAELTEMMKLLELGTKPK